MLFYKIDKLMVHGTSSLQVFNICDEIKQQRKISLVGSDGGLSQTSLDFKKQSFVINENVFAVDRWNLCKAQHEGKNLPWAHIAVPRFCIVAIVVFQVVVERCIDLILDDDDIRIRFHNQIDEIASISLYFSLYFIIQIKIFESYPSARKKALHEQIPQTMFTFVIQEKCQDIGCNPFIMRESTNGK